MFELGQPTALNKQTTELIRKHLALVFKHEIDPGMGDETMQASLNAIHATPVKENPPAVIHVPSTLGPTFRC